MGIGTGTAVFAVLDAVLFRPLPFAEADRVVSVLGQTPRADSWGVSPANYFDWKEGQHSFSAMSATRAGNVTLYLGRPERVGALSVESDFFEVIGVEPALGRRFSPEGDDPLGRTVLFADEGGYWEETRATIVGVVASTLHKYFDNLSEPILYVPLAQRAPLWLMRWLAGRSELLSSSARKGTRRS